MMLNISKKNRFNLPNSDHPLPIMLKRLIILFVATWAVVDLAILGIAIAMIGITSQVMLQALFDVIKLLIVYELLWHLTKWCLILANRAQRLS